MSNEIDLKKVYDNGVINNLLNGAKDSVHEVVIWRLVGMAKHLANVKIDCLRKSRKDFCVSPVTGQEDLVAEMISGQNFIDFYIPGSALLFRCKLRQTEAPHRYYFEMPDFVAQVERRKSLRLNVYDTDDVKLTFTKYVSTPKEMSQKFLKSCFDLSSGGFSFLVSRTEAKFFQIHDPIRTIEFQLGKFPSIVNAQVVLIKEIEPDEFNGLSYKVWRICCRFTHIDEQSKKRIDGFIFERLKETLRAITS